MDVQRKMIPIACLLLLATAVQVGLVRAAFTPALDAVRYAAIAQRMAREGVWSAIRGESEHPLFPVLVHLTHAGLAAARPQSADAWAASVQWAAAVPVVLGVVPVFLLLGRLFGGRGAVGGTLLYCVLPQTARLGADGISDSTHLLLAVTAMWAIVEWLAPRRTAAPGTVRQNEEVAGLAPDGRRADPAAGGPRRPGLPRRSPAWLLLAGACTGLALMARAEAILLPPCLAAVVLWNQLRTSTRRPWREPLVAAGSLLVGLAAVLGPYLLAVEATTPHRALARILGRGDGPATKPLLASANAAPPRPKAIPLTDDGVPLSFAAKETAASTRFRGLAPAVREYLRKLAAAFHYAIGGLTLWGLWTRRRLFRSADVFFGVLFVAVSAAALYVGARHGYLAARHLLLIVPVGLGWAAAGADDLGMRLANAWSGIRLAAGRLAGAADACRSSLAARRSLLGAAVTLAAAAFCLPRLAAPLHHSREGHRQAADWLADQPAAGLVLDTRGWTGLYSGQETRRYDDARAAFGDPRLAFVVVEQPEMQFDSPRAETLRYLLGTSATLAAEFEGREGSPTVLVYRWQPERVAWQEEQRRLK